MVSDKYFNEANQTNAPTDVHIKVEPSVAMDWLLNIKSFCAREEYSDPVYGLVGCKSGVYEAGYNIDEYESYHSPVTDLAKNYKIYKQNSRELEEVITGDAGEVMQTNIFSPHKYTLKEEGGISPPQELTGEYIGDFFHHKGAWYASFVDSFYDMANRGVAKKTTNSGLYGLDVSEEDGIEFKVSSSADVDHPDWIPASGWPSPFSEINLLGSKKYISISKKFFKDKGVDQEKLKNHCLCNVMFINFSDVESLETYLYGGPDVEASGGCESGSEYLRCIEDENNNNFIFEAGSAYRNGVWTSSYNVSILASIDGHCYDNVDEQGYCIPRTPYTVTATVNYRGRTKSKSYTTYEVLNESGFATIEVGAVTVYASPLEDGTYFELM